MKLDNLQIRSYPDPVLRQKAQPVQDVGPQIISLVDEMAHLMIESSGIGLAAPQVGMPLRIILLCLTGKPDDVRVLINPQLNNFQGWAEMEEGCLSLPGIRAKVRRHAACTVNALDQDGNQFVMDVVDLAAAVIQHENDHLDGTLFIDRLNAVSRLGCRKALKQLENDYQQ